jgi:hypothetical protein
MRQILGKLQLIDQFEIHIRPLSKLMFCRFSGLFWPLFDSNCRGNIRKLILPLQFGSKIGSKEPENRQNINFERGLMV